MGRKPSAPSSHDTQPAGSLAGFACPDPECSPFHRFDAAHLSVVEWTGKDKVIRRLSCSACKRRLTARQGTLLRYPKLPEPTVVRIVKCLGHGCSVEAAADICDVDPRTVDRVLEQAGRRAEDFHRPQLEERETPPEAVPLDERHGRVSPGPAKKGGRESLLEAVAAWVGSGSAAPAVVSRFVIDLRVGPRDLATAAGSVASVALGLPVGGTPPLMLVDNPRPYPPAPLQVFGEILHRRRKRVGSVLDYIRHPVHGDDLTHAIWAEERERVLTSALEREMPRKTVPSS